MLNTITLALTSQRYHTSQCFVAYAFCLHFLTFTLFSLSLLLLFVFFFFLKKRYVFKGSLHWYGTIKNAFYFGKMKMASSHAFRNIELEDAPFFSDNFMTFSNLPSAWSIFTHSNQTPSSSVFFFFPLKIIIATSCSGQIKVRACVCMCLSTLQQRLCN